MSADLYRLPPAKLPALEARASRTVARLAADPLPIACSHLAQHVRDGLDAVVCAEHPAAGLMCPPCAAEHTGRHSWEVEHHCDVCGQLADTMRSVLATADVATLTRTTAGRTSIYLGPVLVVALGPCVPCADAAGLRAPEVVER